MIKSRQTAEDEDRLVYPHLLFSIHWCTYISFGDRVSHEVYSEKEYYVAGVVTIFMIIPGFF